MAGCHVIVVSVILTQDKAVIRVHDDTVIAAAFITRATEVIAVVENLFGDFNIDMVGASSIVT